jgi:hypothetical protein
MAPTGARQMAAGRWVIGVRVRLIDLDSRLMPMSGAAVGARYFFGATRGLRQAGMRDRRAIGGEKRRQRDPGNQTRPRMPHGKE